MRIESTAPRSSKARAKCRRSWFAAASGLNPLPEPHALENSNVDHLIRLLSLVFLHVIWADIRLIALESMAPGSKPEGAQGWKLEEVFAYLLLLHGS